MALGVTHALKLKLVFVSFSLTIRCQTNSFKGRSTAVPSTSPAQAATIRELAQPSAGQDRELEPHYFSDSDQMMDK